MIEITAGKSVGKPLEDLKIKTLQGLQRAVVNTHTELLAILSVPNEGKKVKRKRKTSAGPKGSSYTIYPNSSLPGEPPRVRTGNLRRNVLYSIDPETMSAKIGITEMAIYGLFHEVGLGNRSRPWLGVTVTRMLPKIKAWLEM